MEIVKNKVENDIILSNHELSDKEIIRAYSALVKKLNKQIVDLETDHDLLIDDKEKMFEDMRKQIKFQSDARKRVLKQLEIYKKAFEIAEEDGLNMEDYFKEAKEKIDEQKTSKTTKN